MQTKSIKSSFFAYNYNIKVKLLSKKHWIVEFQGSLENPVLASKNCFSVLAIKKVYIYHFMDDAECDGKNNDVDA